MEEPSDSGVSEAGFTEPSQWPSDIVEKLQPVQLIRRRESVGRRSPSCNLLYTGLSPQAASQALWATGTYSGRLPNGFYSVIPDKKLKEMFNTIPSLEELSSMGMARSRAEVVIVDAEKDKKLFMLKQWSAALVKGHHSSPASVVKKLAELVSEFYMRSSDQSPAKTHSEESSLVLEHTGFLLLGQIRNASCRPRAILFKVLADAVNLDCKLMVGVPTDGSMECVDSYRHLSVAVVLNSVELLVDLTRFPGQLIPISTKAILRYHISASGESDSAENDSCDSPLEPNSPLYGLSEKLDAESLEYDDTQSFCTRRPEVVSVASPLRNVIMHSAGSDGKLSSSRSESNIANAVRRRGSRRTAVAEQRTASSSPEHPFFRTHGRSMLSCAGGAQSSREDTDGVPSSRSDGASTSEPQRIRRRSISITPEIGDDIVRAVRAMNDMLKQNRGRGGEDLVSYSLSEKNSFNDDQASPLCRNMRNQPNSSSNHKSMSLPSSPHELKGEISERHEVSKLGTEELFSMWNKVVQSSSFANQPLLPFQEWNIDFSELTVGSRVGIGFFGEVFRGTWNGTDVAIKVFLEQGLTSENMENFCNEISILSRLRHPNVILFLGACMRPPYLSMVTEYMERGSLYYILHVSEQKRKLTWRRRLKILQDICRGLMCIHRMKIVHRDLKSANCLVDQHWTVKVCDFGLSRMMTDTPIRDSSSAGTPEWMAPELIRNEPFTEKCDIFSLGVIMWELCTLSKPWEGVPPVQVVNAVANEGTQLEIPEGPLGRLIADCWAEPDKRPNCQTVLSQLLDCEYTLC